MNDGWASNAALLDKWDEKEDGDNKWYSSEFARGIFYYSIKWYNNNIQIGIQIDLAMIQVGSNRIKVYFGC